MDTFHRTVNPWALAVALLLPFGAWSSEPQTSAPAETSPPVADDADAGLGDPVSDESLAEARGRAELHVNENNLEAIVEGNVATNLSTGNNTITESAFSNNSGLPMVIQNSGNNVIIQNSTILNLQLK